MGRLILITKEKCENCDWVKSKIPKELEIEFIDGNTREGMAELSYYGRYDAENTIVPVFIVEDEGEDGSYIGTVEIKNKMLELKNGKE